MISRLSDERSIYNRHPRAAETARKVIHEITWMINKRARTLGKVIRYRRSTCERNYRDVTSCPSPSRRRRWPVHTTTTDTSRFTNTTINDGPRLRQFRAADRHDGSRTDVTLGGTIRSRFSAPIDRVIDCEIYFPTTSRIESVRSISYCEMAEHGFAQFLLIDIYRSQLSQWIA